MERVEKEMKALRLQQEEKVRKQQYEEQLMKEKLMGEVRCQPSPQEIIIPNKIEEITPPALNHLYPIHQVPSGSYETKASAKYTIVTFD